MDINIRSTTIIGVRYKGKVAMAGDGQVTFGEMAFKQKAVKVRQFETIKGGVLGGFAGAAADALTLFEKFEQKLDQYEGEMKRAIVELAKDWRTDKMLRHLDAMLVVMDKNNSFIISGDGNVIEPDGPIVAIGSGGGFAQAAALAFLQSTKFSAKHGGIDFYIKVGSPILAAADGKVYGVNVKDRCVGNQFAIDFGKGLDGKKLYATHMHVGKIHVKKGDEVKRGQLVADSGELVKGPCGGGMQHLHFHMSKTKGKGGNSWGSWRFLGGPKGWLNPHEYWTGGRGKPECFVEGKEYPEGLLTLPVACY